MFDQSREVHVRVLAPVLSFDIAQVIIEAVTVDGEHYSRTVHFSTTVGQCDEVVCEQGRGLPILWRRIRVDLSASATVEYMAYVRERQLTTLGRYKAALS